MGLYARYVWAPLLDWFMRQPPVMAQRRRVVPSARGRVLEIGIGSGLNLGFYDATRVEAVWGLEPSLELQAVARRRAERAAVPVEFVTASAERIPLDAASFDTVVTTWTLCSIPDAARALGEMRRVLKPDGRLVFTEHGLSSELGVARWQRRLNPCWHVLSGGCNIDRGIESLVRGAGFRIERLENLYLEGPKLLTYTYAGSAAPAT
jgi:SAM-dependent methyltransferase